MLIMARKEKNLPPLKWVDPGQQPDPDALSLSSPTRWGETEVEETHGLS